MKDLRDDNTPMLPNMESSPFVQGSLILNKEKFIQILTEVVNAIEDFSLLKKRMLALQRILLHRENDDEGLLNIVANGDTVCLRRDVLLSEVEQILKSRTIDRAKYYVRRLKNSISKVKYSKVNDINLSRWKEYEEIITDSLWILDKRDSSGAHLGWYWGNFVPQIPHQLMLRYTKKGDWVLDSFLGSGTTLIECRRLGRNGVGIELNPEVAQKAKEIIY
jgi:hypothetical protein